MLSCSRSVVYVPYAIKILLIPTSFIGYLLVLSAAVTLPHSFLGAISAIGMVIAYWRHLYQYVSTITNPIHISIFCYTSWYRWETPIGYITALIC